MIKNFIKRILATIDKRFKTSLYKKAANFEKSWYNSNFLNLIRRSMNTTIVRWKYTLGIKDRGLLKLHLGYGGKFYTTCNPNGYLKSIK